MADQPIIDDVVNDKVDREVIVALQKFISEILQSSYSPLMEAVFQELVSPNARIEEDDNCFYFRLQAFFLEAVRVRAHLVHQNQVMEANPSGTKQRVKVAFKIDISLVGSSLQYQSFDYLFATLTRRVIGKKDLSQHPVRDVDFHAGIKMLIQFLLTVQDMAACVDAQSEECARNRRNAHVLKSYLFRHEVWRLVLCGFQMFNPSKHALDFLKDVVSLNHIMIQMLEDFSKGKILTVKT